MTNDSRALSLSPKFNAGDLFESLCGASRLSERVQVAEKIIKVSFQFSNLELKDYSN